MLSEKNKKDLSKIQKQLENSDSERESLIKQSRDIIKLSKQLIYSTHRNDKKEADSAHSQILVEFKKFSLRAKKDPELFHSGFSSVAAQEFVEAVAYYEYVNNRKIPTSSELEVHETYYLLGLCDLTGELVRKAIYSVINNDFKTALDIHATVRDIYEQLMLFDFRNGELRKKFDGIKYDMKKLEDLILELKLKNKI